MAERPFLLSEFHMARASRVSVFDQLVTRSLAHPLPKPVQYIAAGGIIVVVGVLRARFITDELPWLLFIPPILAIALVTGRGPGLFASVLATVMGGASIGSAGAAAWLTRPQWMAAALFLLVMAVLVALVAELRRSMARTRRLNAELAGRELELADREAFLSSVLAASPDCIKVVELDGTLSFMTEGGMKLQDISDFNAVRGCPWPDLLTGEGSAAARRAITDARQGRTSAFETYADTFIGTPKYWAVSVSPIRAQDGSVARILSVSRDHTALEDGRQQQRLLNDELSHRLKNVLMLVQSLANQTFRGADSLESASAAFASRLASLGQAANVLTGTSWRQAELHAVVDAGLTSAEGTGDRVSVDGPSLTLDPQAALGLTMVLHELTTNAIKYGALSNNTGRVAVRWQVKADDTARGFFFSWKEEGGPPVMPPTHQGFGSRLIGRSLQSYFRGEINLSYPPGGVEFSIHAPVPSIGEHESKN